MKFKREVKNTFEIDRTSCGPLCVSPVKSCWRWNQRISIGISSWLEAVGKQQTFTEKNPPIILAKTLFLFLCRFMILSGRGGGSGGWLQVPPHLTLPVSTTSTLCPFTLFENWPKLWSDWLTVSILQRGGGILKKKKKCVCNFYSLFFTISPSMSQSQN